MAIFGVSRDGFDLKGFDVILAESFARAREVFHDPERHDLDLSATSPLRKILEVTAAEDAELWKRMEALYYSNFISTAYGQSLDRLGDDLGVQRNFLFATGSVRLTLQGGAPGREYKVPAGAILTTAAADEAFHTLEPATLSDAAPEVEVPAQAFERGWQGNTGADTVVVVDPEYQSMYLHLGTATLKVTNLTSFTGGDTLEGDESFRTRLLGRPRGLWTLESVRRDVMEVPGVLDVLAADSLGGVDVSQSYYNLFDFGDRVFSRARRLGQPYFFDVVVAHEWARPWRTQGAVEGVYERVQRSVDRVRPVGIHANVIQADHIEVGVRARVSVDAGHDAQALVGSIKERLARDVGNLRLGGAVLFSQTLRAFVEQPGVVDVQRLHLRRWPPALGRISFGGVPFQSEIVEAPVGENLSMGRTEIATFRLDSDLIEIEVNPR